MRALIILFALIFSNLTFAFLPHSMAPAFGELKAVGNDIYLGNDYWLPNADLDAWPGIRASDFLGREPDKSVCFIPDVEYGVPEDRAQDLRVLACDEPYVWVTLEAYCSEGMEMYSGLFRVDLSDGTVRSFAWIPQCYSAVSLTEAGGAVWIGTARPVEMYRDQPATGVIRVVESEKNGPQFSAFFPELTVRKLISTDSHLVVFAYEGVGSIEYKTGLSERRFYDFSIDSNDSLRIVLAPDLPAVERFAIFRFLSSMPVIGRSEFLDVLAREKARDDRVSVDEPSFALISFYIDALKRFPEDGDEYWHYHSFWHFGFLLERVLLYRDRLGDEIDEIMDYLSRKGLPKSSKKLVLEAIENLKDPDFEPRVSRCLACF